MPNSLNLINPAESVMKLTYKQCITGCPTDSRDYENTEMGMGWVQLVCRIQLLYKLQLLEQK